MTGRPAPHLPATQGVADHAVTPTRPAPLRSAPGHTDDLTLARHLMDAGLSSGEAARVIADARATLRLHETLPLAAARILLCQSGAHVATADHLRDAATIALNLSGERDDTRDDLSRRRAADRLRLRSVTRQAA